MPEGWRDATSPFCGAFAPARAGAPNRTRSITQVSEMSLAAVSGEQEASEGRLPGFPLPLLRRTEQLNWLHELLTAPPQTLQFAVFQGPRGSGKSRLLSEFCRLAPQAQWRRASQRRDREALGFKMMLNNNGTSPHEEITRTRGCEQSRIKIIFFSNIQDTL